MRDGVAENVTGVAGGGANSTKTWAKSVLLSFTWMRSDAGGTMPLKQIVPVSDPQASRRVVPNMEAICCVISSGPADREVRVLAYPPNSSICTWTGHWQLELCATF